MDNSLFLKVTNKTLQIIFKLILRYFTVWILIFHFIYYIGFNYYQYSLLFCSILISICGFILTYIYPKKITVPYVNLIITNKYLIVFDLIFHQLPLLLLLYFYNKKIKNDNLIFGLSLLVLYLVLNDPIKIYKLY